MGKNGGARPGAGRPKGAVSLATRQAMEYKAILMAEIHKNALPLAQALVKKGVSGDTPALKEIHDRSLGKVKEELDVTSNGESIGVIVLPTLRNGKDILETSPGPTD